MEKMIARLVISNFGHELNVNWGSRAEFQQQQRTGMLTVVTGYTQ